MYTQCVNNLLSLPLEHFFSSQNKQRGCFPTQGQWKLTAQAAPTVLSVCGCVCIIMYKTK